MLIENKKIWQVAISGILIAILPMLLIAIAGLNNKIAKTDVALVLGSKIQADGTPSLRLRARLDKAAELYHAGYYPMIIASGALGKEGYVEAVVMRDYLVGKGIPSEHIIVDEQARNTFESAQKTAQIMSKKKFQSVMVITQYFHIPRSCLALKKFGVKNIYNAHANYIELRDFYSLAREVVAYVKYYFRSYD